jgi:4-diphosphocytidyl-2-C-methyl-D-erythritol kinase
VNATRWPAPAKLNLFLHVVGRRADGYHLLQTLFQLLDYGDELTIEVREDGMVRRVGDVEGVPPESDLVVRAANTLKAATGTRLGADLAIAKRIPIGGGLGGGSSDAATTLVALNALWRCGLGPDALATLGLGLGADVPVFVHGRTAWAEGVGERLTPVETPSRAYLVLDPRVAVSTAAVFQAPELTRDSAPTTIPRFVAGEPVRNDLEPVVRSMAPAVADALDWLGARAPARLTGSGACVFAAFDRLEAAERVAAECPDRFRAFVASGVPESPLHAALRQWQGQG